MPTKQIVNRDNRKKRERVREKEWHFHSIQKHTFLSLISARGFTRFGSDHTIRVPRDDTLDGLISCQLSHLATPSAFKMSPSSADQNGNFFCNFVLCAVLTYLVSYLPIWLARCAISLFFFSLCNLKFIACLSFFILFVYWAETCRGNARVCTSSYFSPLSPTCIVYCIFI